jgi:hypothetical protein
MLTGPYDPLNPNGATVIAHDPDTGTTYIRLPEALWRITGNPDGSCGCKCPSCEKSGSPGYWDTLAVPPKGTAWTCHMPDPWTFQEYVNKEFAKKKAARKANRDAAKAKKATKTPPFNPNKGAPWE